MHLLLELTECSPSTVSRELARNKTKTGKYSPKVAQEISEERKERFRKERKFTKEMKVLVIKYISEEQWSVEQIVGYCRKKWNTNSRKNNYL